MNKIVFLIAFLISTAAYAADSACEYCTETGVPPLPGNYQILPDPIRTPGVTNPDITQDNINDTICNPEWHTKSIRPPVKYTNRLKRQQIGEYGYKDREPRHYEEDHLIPLEAGGNPTDPKNLWPEPWKTTPNAGDKDKVENYIHTQICNGSMTLDEAQKQIATDWTVLLKKMQDEGYVDSWHTSH